MSYREVALLEGLFFEAMFEFQHISTMIAIVPVLQVVGASPSFEVCEKNIIIGRRDISCKGGRGRKILESTSSVQSRWGGTVPL